MKLKNKLIPIGTILTTAATLAPVALTSCSSSMVNLIDGYRPSIDKAVWEDYKADKKDMLTFYASAVNENPQIFAQDIYWADAANYLYRLDTECYQSTYAGYGYITDINSMQGKVSNIAVHKRNCKDFASGSEETVVYYTVDFDYEFKINYKSMYHYWGQTNPMYFSLESNDGYTYKLRDIPVVINRTDWNAWDLANSGYNYAYAYSPNYWFSNASQILNFLPTDWVVQVNMDGGYDYDVGEFKISDHSAFTNLEKNGFNWSASYNLSYETTSTNLSTKQSTTEKDERNVTFDKDELFDSENELYVYATRYLLYWYNPSYYLSNIVDVDQQIWGEE